MVVYTMPLILMALLIGPRSTALVAVGSIAVVLGVEVLEFVDLPFVSQMGDNEDISIPAVATFIGLIPVISFLLAQAGNSLRASLFHSMQREQELAGLNMSLEHTVLERTATLEAALERVKQRELLLQQTLGELQASQQTIQGLSAPIIPVLPNVLVAPMIGAIDNQRADVFMRNILAAVEQYRARYIIIDITGVPVVDTYVAGVVMRTATAVGLLGGKVWLVGIRPEVAQTMVALGVDWQGLVTYPDLQAAVTAFLSSATRESFGW